MNVYFKVMYMKKTITILLSGFGFLIDCLCYDW